MTMFYTKTFANMSQNIWKKKHFCKCFSTLNICWRHVVTCKNKIFAKHLQLEKVALDCSVECCAPPPRWCDLELWPFDPKNVISSSLSRDAPVTKVWRKSVNRYWRYRGNIKLPRESRTDGRTQARTENGTDGRPENIASAGAYRRRRLKNALEVVTCKIKQVLQHFHVHGIATGSQQLQNIFVYVLQMFHFTSNHSLTSG